MISFCMISCMYDIIETKKLHNIHYTFINYRWSHPRSSNYRRPRPWTRTSGTIRDLADGLQLGLEPTTQALEIQRFNHYAMERSNKQSNSLCIYYQPSWLARREKNWNLWLEIAFHLLFQRPWSNSTRMLMVLSFSKFLLMQSTCAN